MQNSRNALDFIHDLILNFSKEKPKHTYFSTTFYFNWNLIKYFAYEDVHCFWVDFGHVNLNFSSMILTKCLANLEKSRQVILSWILKSG